MRLPWPAVAAGLAVAVLGAGGIVRGAMPQASGSGNSGSANPNPIVVTGAFVRPPVPPTTNAAAYFTVYNTTGTPDRLLDVASGAGAVAVLHTAGMTPTNGVVIPAHGRLTLSPGKGHVMIEQVTGTLKAGQHVNLELDFANAGSIDVTAVVIDYGTPAPTPSGAPS
jgi:copper(I)-binding protein